MNIYIVVFVNIFAACTFAAIVPKCPSVITSWKDELIIDNQDCFYYYHCINGVAQRRPCPKDLIYNPNLSVSAIIIKNH